MDRAAWLTERRRTIEERADTIHAPTYDEVGGVYNDATQHRMVARLLALCPANARILDTACGTGKYWPLILDGGRTLVGRRPVGRHAATRPGQVPTRSKRTKSASRNWHWEDAFDGITCVDAMEFVFPEDWPRVLSNFQRALYPHGLLYFSVELPEDDLAEVFAAAVADGLPVVAGEYVKAGGYHYYPDIDQVRAWVDAAGFDILEEAVGDWYHHIIARKR